MNGDRSNHQGRVKVAEKAALPPAVRKASGFPLSHHVLPSPPWGRGAGGEGIDTANAHGGHPGSQLSRCDPQTGGTKFATPSPGPPRLKRTPAAGHPLPQGGEGQRAKNHSANARCLVVFGAMALLAFCVVSRGPYPYAATPAPQQVKTA